MDYLQYKALCHHGIKGQKWGVRNAEWYPIAEWKASKKSKDRPSVVANGKMSKESKKAKKTQRVKIYREKNALASKYYDNDPELNKITKDRERLERHRDEINEEIDYYTRYDEEPDPSLNKQLKILDEDLARLSLKEMDARDAIEDRIVEELITKYGKESVDDMNKHLMSTAVASLFTKRNIEGSSKTSVNGTDKMTPNASDSDVTKKVKRDYNNLTDEEFKRKYSTTKEVYAKRVEKYGDPYMNAPLAKLAKKLTNKESDESLPKSKNTSRNDDKESTQKLSKLNDDLDREVSKIFTNKKIKEAFSNPKEVDDYEYLALVAEDYGIDTDDLWKAIKAKDSYQKSLR